jgi:L-alanine-DL-glutamate epimerase-like enolase superfamily enzyme
MKIAAVTSRSFTYRSDIARDSHGHAHPGPPRDAVLALLTIGCDDGAEGHVIAPPGDVAEDLLARFVRPVLLGADPWCREQLWQALYKWQRGSGGRLTDRVLCAVELALWDLIGKVAGQPVWKLAGGYRDRIPA